MPRRRSFRRRGGFRRARSFIRRTVAHMGPIEAKRVLLDGLTIPDKTSAAYDNPLSIDLLTTSETVNEELISNGSTIAEAKNYSKVVGMKLRLYIQGAVSEAVTVRYLLYKKPDGEALISDLADSSFHSSVDDQNGRELRGQILSKGILTLSQSRGSTSIPLFIKRSTLRRLGSLRENDKFTLLIAMQNVATTQPLVFGMGTIYVRMN